MADFRLDYLNEAMECLAQFKRGQSQDEYNLRTWVNLLGAAANAAMASIPDSVMEQYEAQEELKAAARKHVKKALRAS